MPVSAGQKIRASDLNAFTQPWATYTPVWAATGTAVSLGNGTITGRYQTIGKAITMVVKLTMGSTTTYGTGTYSITLPVTSGASASSIGSCYLRDASAGSSGHFSGMTYVAAASGILVPFASSSNAVAGPTIPFTWASTDFLIAQATYEIT